MESLAVHLAISHRSSHDPAPFLDSAIDLGAWLAKLEDEDRAIVAARYAGDSLKEIGAVTGRSISATFSRLRSLGRNLIAWSSSCPFATHPCRQRCAMSV